MKEVANPFLEKENPLRLFPALVLGASFLAPLPAWTQATAKAPKVKAKATPASPLAAPVKVTSVEGITEYRLGNGLRVLLFPDPSKPNITTNITYLVGSRHENYGETGMAHLLEHLVFKGTPKHPDVPKVLNELGADFNGTTWVDRTNYYISFPASDANLTRALELEADRMLNSNFTKETLWGKDGKSGEMTVVRNEFEIGENNPVRVTLQRIQALAFDWHNYGKSTIGARTDIENVNVDRLRAFYHRYYQPDNAILLVAGKIDEAKTLAQINHLFGGLKKPKRVLEPTYTLEPTQDGERSVSIRRVGGTPILMVGYRIAPTSHEDRSRLDLAMSMLASAPSGRLYKALVEPKLAAQVFPIAFSTLEPGLFLFAAALPKDGDVEKAKEVLLKELENLKDKPFTQAELDREKVKLQATIEHTLSDTKNLAVSLSESMAAGDWRHWFIDRDRSLAAGLPDIQKAAESYFKPANRTLAQYLPTEKPDRTEVPGVPDIAAMVKDYKGKAVMAQGEAFEATPETVDKRTVRFSAPNGLKGALLSKKSKGSLVSTQLTLHFGNEAALMNKGAAPGLVGAMLMRGTAKHTREALKDAFDKLKAQVNVGGGATSATVNLSTTRENLPGALRLVAEVLREPAFPASEFDTLLKQQSTNLEAQKMEPQAKAMEVIGRTFDAYPVGHPSAFRSSQDRLEDLKAVTLEDLKAFHQAMYGADRAVFTASGDFDAKEIQALVVNLFGEWKAQVPYTRIQSRLKTTAGQTQAIETPDKQMAVFMAQQRWALKDTDTDYAAFLMANHILGGGALKSRIADRLRQKEGLSYGAGSGFNANSLDPVAVWQGFAMYAPQNAAKLEAAFHDELGKALKEGLTQEELDFARKSWLTGESVERQEDGAIVRWLGQSLHLGRPVTWQSELESKVKALTLDQVNTALRTHLQPSQLVIVKAGDFAKAAVATPVAGK